MEFAEYLKWKKIDPEKFRCAQFSQYAEFKQFFNQVHPDSFTQQKLFMINKIRRTYKLEERAEEAKNFSEAVRPKVKSLKLKMG